MDYQFSNWLSFQILIKQLQIPLMIYLIINSTAG